MSNVWVVGVLDERDRELANGEAKRWEFVGVFDSAEKADAACVGELFFMAPIELNWACPAERSAWPGCIYPRLPGDGV